MAKNGGKSFEEQFKKSCEKQNILCIRLIDSNKFGFGDNTRFTPNNIADFICFDSKVLLIAELKHTQGTSISFSFDKGGTPMIKPKQIQSLLDHVYPNAFPMLILDYADRTNKAGKVLEGGTFAIKIKDFYEWANSVDKKSININDAREIGYEISRRRKKVNYEYDIKSLLDVIK